MPIGTSTFSEASGEEWSAEREKLLQKRIKDLGLKLEGTYLEGLVQRLYGELQAAGIKLKPKVYLSDEWSCPDGVPLIGIPFYLADKKLSRLEDEMMDGIEAESHEEILRYLRHEAGHAFNYAYKLYDTAEWRDIFGSFSRPYKDDYTPNPFSRNFVKHISGWYAQKHPDEDFAESFAVWLTPGSDWKEVYKDWGCHKKLLYVDRMARKLGQTSPLVTEAVYDPASEDLSHSIADHYRKVRPSLVELPAHFDNDLREIFDKKPPEPKPAEAPRPAEGPRPAEAPRPAEGARPAEGPRPTEGKEEEWQPAEKFLTAHRREMVRRIALWTGLNDVLVRSLVNHFTERCRFLKLWVNPKKSHQVLMDLLAFSTTLCMNRLYKGDFIIK